MLRAWERRYGLVSPQRTDSRYRLYSDDDVEILKGAKALVEEGLRIAEIARLPRDQLRQAAGRPPKGAIADGPWPLHAHLEAAIDAIAALDGERLDKLLFRMSGMGALPAREICERLLLPLLREIGDRWEKKRLSIAAEHFGSTIVRTRLQNLLASEARHGPDAAKVVCACPEGELHEGGLLAFAVHAAGSGFDVIFLGANSPLDEILAAAETTQARAVALSITRPLGKALRTQLIARLSSWKAVGVDRRVFLGGPEASREQDRFRKSGFLVSELATGVPLAWRDPK